MTGDPRDDHDVDPLVRLRAELDQAVAMAPELARTARGYYEAFGAEGFSERQALFLTIAELLQNPGVAP